MKEEISRELWRQIVHALGIILVPLAFAFGKNLVGIASFAVASIIFLLAEHRKNNTDMDSASKRSASQYVMNPDTKKSAPAGVTSNSPLTAVHNVFEKFDRSGENYRGAFYFYLASAVSLFLFSQQVAMLSITVLALGDSFSTAVGIFGKRKIFYNRKKTWEGTFAGFAAAFASCFLINPMLALPAAFTGMIIESLPLKIDDNLTIPILTGIILSLFV